MSIELMPKKGTGNSTDGIYAKVVEPIEESLDFFVGKEIKVKKEDEVDGFESFSGQGQVASDLVMSFALARPTLTQTTLEIDGTESFGEKAKSVLRTLVQLAKDAVAWLMSLINNKIVRIDNRRYRLSSRRKRHGLHTKDVKYPSVVRRLMAPNRVTEDGQWIKESIEAVNDFYITAMSVYKQLLDRIKIEPSTFDYSRAIDGVNKLFVSTFKMSANKTEDDGVVTFNSQVLPGNRYFIYKASTPSRIVNGAMYFDNTTMEVKLKAQEFRPTSFTIDATLTSIANLINTVRDNQKTVGELHRRFEKAVVAFVNKEDVRLSPEQRTYLDWLISLSKNLNAKSINYVTSSVDAGLDFCQAGINE
ncbi:putative phiKZ-like internal heard protein [Aeromonas phage CF8]|nr:putative phiKZ-like internal heard protein [Aeromonas phage CF8]